MTEATVAVQRLRMRYAKRGRLRFTSHRDIQRALERAIRRARIPIAFSAGFNPHPKISYAGAAPTGAASEAEYLELSVTEECDPSWVKEALDRALPAGIDVLDVVPAGGAALPERLEASAWEVRLDGVDPDSVAAAVATFLAAECVEVERLTKKGRRHFDTRAPVVCLVTDRRAAVASGVRCAILRMVVRNTMPAVRPDDVLAGLRQAAALPQASPPMVTRVAQGPLDQVTGELADPLGIDRESGVAGDVVPMVPPVEDEDVVGARSPR